MRAPDKNRYSFRAPLSLWKPHSSADFAVVLLDDFLAVVDHLLGADPKSDLQRSDPSILAELESIGTSKTAALELLAGIVVQLRNQTFVGYKAFRLVEEEFGAVAQGIAEYTYQSYGLRGCRQTRIAAVSWHELAFWLAKRAIVHIADTIGLLGDVDGYYEENKVCETFTCEDFVSRCKDQLLPTLAAIRYIDRDSGLHLCRVLKQELFRAWKRKYPDDSVSFETLSVDSAIAREAASDSLTEISERVARPYGARRRVWLRWKREDGLGPAGIRDRWNAMSERERYELCPGVHQRIGKGNSGREVVKKALQKAEKRRKGEGP